HAVDRLGIEARQVDRISRLAALDRLQVALAGLQPYHSFLAEEARERVPLFAVNHDHVAVFVLRQHGIARNLKGDGFSGNREGEFDVPETLGRDLLVLRFDGGAGPDPAHDRYRVESEIFHNRSYFGRLDEPDAGQDLGNRARPYAHGPGQPALTLARSLES